MRLDVGEAAIKQTARAINSEGLDRIGVLRAAIVSATDGAFDRFVAENRPLRLKHATGHNIFRGDELNPVLLATPFALYGGGQLWVGGEALGKVAGMQRIQVASLPRRPRHPTAGKSFTFRAT